MTGKYILDEEGYPIPCEELREWAEWMETSLWKHRSLARDEIVMPDGTIVIVSTIFLAIDYALMGGPPILWETMIFNGPLDMHIERYSDPDTAREGHEHLVKKVSLTINQS